MMKFEKPVMRYYAFKKEHVLTASVPDTNYARAVTKAKNDAKAQNDAAANAIAVSILLEFDN